MNANHDGSTERARIRVVMQELIRLLDAATKHLPTHRPRTLQAVRSLAAAVKALPTPEVTALDLGGVFDQLDAAPREDAGTNSLTAITE